MGKTLTTQEFIEKAKLVHNEKYDYSKVDYKKSSKKVIIVCKEHGEFEQTPNIHLDNHGCPACSKLKKRNDISKIPNIKLSNYIVSNPIELSGKLEIIGSIYLFINPINNKKYIGKTIMKLSSRFSAHLNKSKHSDYYFYRSIRKYGWNVFEKHVLYQTEIVDNNKENKKLIDSIICGKEIEFINLFESNNPKFGYNETNGGEGTAGCKFSNKVKEKMSNARKD